MLGCAGQLMQPIDSKQGQFCIKCVSLHLSSRAGYLPSSMITIKVCSLWLITFGEA
jgi:hypothetical protein